jgi:hypothetical protein
MRLPTHNYPLQAVLRPAKTVIRYSKQQPTPASVIALACVLAFVLMFACAVALAAKGWLWL